MLSERKRVDYSERKQWYSDVRSRFPIAGLSGKEVDPLDKMGEVQLAVLQRIMSLPLRPDNFGEIVSRMCDLSWCDEYRCWTAIALTMAQPSPSHVFCARLAGNPAWIPDDFEFWAGMDVRKAITGNDQPQPILVGKGEELTRDQYDARVSMKAKQIVAMLAAMFHREF